MFLVSFRTAASSVRMFCIIMLGPVFLGWFLLTLLFVNFRSLYQVPLLAGYIYRCFVDDRCVLYVSAERPWSGSSLGFCPP